MENNFTRIGNILFQNLDCAAYQVSKRLTDVMGYDISEERASYLIARALVREVTIDQLCNICKIIEDQCNEEYANKIHKIFGEKV